MINKGKVLNLNKIKNVNFFTKNKYLLAVCAVYLTGIVCSVIFYKKSGGFNWSGIFDFLYLGREKSNFIKIYALSFLCYLSVLALFFIAGTSITGIGTVPVIIFLLAYFMGGLTSYLYVTYSLKGIAFNTLIIFPPSVIFIIICFIAAKLSLDYSSSLTKLILKRMPAGSPALGFKSYGKSYLILSISLAAVSLIDTVLSVLFLSIFNF